MQPSAKQLRKRLAIPIAALLLATTFGAAATAQRAVAPTVNPGTETPMSGIKVLEGIILRIHNSPQLAYQSQQKMMSPPSAQGGPTDPLTAIKPPKETNYTPSYTIASVPPSLKKASFYNAPRSMQVMDARPVIMDYRSNGATDAVAQSAPAAPQMQSAAVAEPSGWGQLRANLNRFGGALQQLQSAQRQAEIAANSAGKPMPGSRGTWNSGSNANRQTIAHSGITEYGNNQQSANAYMNNAPMFSGATNATIAPTNSADMATTPAEMPQANTRAANANLPAPPVVPANAPVMVPAHPESYKYLREIGSDSKEKTADKSTVRRESRKIAARKDAARLTEIAFLPPNVVSGIPLVPIGASAVQAERLLAPHGKIYKQTINRWTVWTLNKHNSNQPAIYVYMRHGIVEALRIFDTSLITPDMGIELGAAVSDVKQRFGEPAFMISEPNADPSIGGQNYVYPLSHVGFQMARRKPSDLPQLVSVMIFTLQ